MRALLFILLSLPLSVWADQESDFLAMRDAFRAGDRARVEKLAPHFNATPFEPYATFYRLHLDWDAPEKLSEINAYLSRPMDTPMIENFRGDWLKHLAALQRWKEFAEAYPLHVNEDAELACYALQFRQYSAVTGVLNEARGKWFSGAALPESCTPLFDAAIAKGVLTQQDIWSRIRLALEAGNVALAKQLIAKLPSKTQASLAGLDKAAANPNKYLNKINLAKAKEGPRLVALFALLRVDRQSPDNAHEHWHKIAKFFPEAERQYFYGWLAYFAALSLDENALAWYKEAGDSVLNDNQLAWRTRAALRAGDWREVHASINKMSPQQQRVGAWRYWQARALKVLGRPLQAESMLTEQSREYNFYGQLAADELGLPAAAAVSATPYHLEKAELAAMAQNPAVQRTLALYRMDLRTEAAKEWSWLSSRLTDTQLLMAAEVARQNEMFDRSIYAADHTLETHDFTLRYPAPYRNSLSEHVNEFGLDEAWVYGLMRQESRFVTRAKSNVGAAGLMQVMPATARWIAKKLHMVDYRKELIHQLDVNLKLGTFYMKNVLSSLEESPVLASAAYNAGPGRARHWRADKPLEGAIYAETIPFDETRDYVKKVMSNTMYYSKIFEQPAQTLKQRLGTIAAKSPENMRVVQDER